MKHDVDITSQCHGLTGRATGRLKTGYESEQLSTFCTITHIRTSFLKTACEQILLILMEKLPAFMWHIKKTQTLIILTWSPECNDRFFITEAPEKTTEAHFSHEHIKQRKSLEQEMKTLVMVRGELEAGRRTQASVEVGCDFRSKRQKWSQNHDLINLRHFIRVKIIHHYDAHVIQIMNMTASPHSVS